MPPTELRSPPRHVDGETAVRRPLLDVSDVCSKSSLRSEPCRRPSDSRAPTLNTLAQILFAVSIAVYVWGQVMYLSPSIQLSFMNAIGPFWGIPLTPPPPGSPLKAYGHYEMLAPTFFVLFTVLPLLASLLLFEFVRDYNLHRHTARRVLAVAALLRRKPPRILGLPRTRELCYGELLFAASLVVGNVLLFVYGWVNQRRFLPRAGDPYDFDTVLELSGIVFGYSSVFNMAFLFLPCTRHCAWMEFFNISYANGVKYHRWLGMLAIVGAILHAIPFYWLWARQGVLAEQALPCFDCQLDYWHVGYPKWFNVFGEISLFFLLAVLYTSHPWVRRHLFETFYYAHHLYIPAVFFAVLHFNVIVWWLLPTLVLYLASRTISRWNSLFAVQVLEFTRLPEGLVKIVLARAATQLDGGYDIGQFVYLNVPAISKLQWHAFTISSSPRTSPASLTILAKSLGDWTGDLVQHAQECREKGKLPLVYMDGYYGASLAGYDEYSTVCLVGGGIGATPLFAILEDMVARLEKLDPALPTQHIFLVLAIRELALLEEISPILAKIKHLDPRGERFTLRFNLTRTPREAMLDTPIDYERFRGATSSIQDGADVQARGFMRLLRGAPAPFIEPLRSRGAKIVLYSAMLVPLTLLIMWLEFDNGVLMDHGKKTQYWPLQNFVEIGVVFLIPIVAYALLMASRWRRSPQTINAKHSSMDHDVAQCNYSSIRPTSPTTASQGVFEGDTSLRTLRDLVDEYDVACGSRPNMAQILRDVHERHNTTSGTAIGVFISGPEALKAAADDAIADLGSHNFDVHEEEFEL
ncbi:ferric/cupric-chelate reductase [Phytophthora pseudosyringae]|uniref:Ferric/cupric-chelate reductase n=1 Tax=Phytophthora pseudosyringae TaxID=221518 RepID=A0A8T1W6K6_9STRA|nr:ferric/cupric-chelate reductase [Phytophthora pseudosyringae]